MDSVLAVGACTGEAKGLLVSPIFFLLSGPSLLLALPCELLCWAKEHLTVRETKDERQHSSRLSAPAESVNLLI